MFPVHRHTVFLTLAGSQAHGTARAGSDIDLRGVCVAPLPIRLSLFEKFEQHEGPLHPELAERVLPKLRAHPTAGRAVDTKIECVVFEVAKMVRLCAEANPGALEILFADERDWVLATPTWERLHAERHRFLSKRVAETFVGYGMAQLKRIKTHRAWLLEPPGRKPSRGDFGLPTTGPTLSRDDQHRIERDLAELAESHSVSLPKEVVAILDAERRYRAALKHWESFETWQRERNPARAELERVHGYDTKHAMHLVRLMRMGVEVLERGELIVRRPDAPELASIRDGALSYDALIELAASLQGAMRLAAVRSALPDEADPERADRLAFELTSEGSGG